MLDLPGWLQVIEKGLSQVIAGCNVQIFFLLSAVLLFRSGQKYGTVLKKRVRTLLLPYLIWNTFWVAVFAVLQSLPFATAYFSGNNTPILQSSVKEWLGLYGIGQDFPQCYPLWFVRDLIVMVLIFPVIKTVVNRFPRAMFLHRIFDDCFSNQLIWKDGFCMVSYGRCIRQNADAYDSSG